MKLCLLCIIRESWLRWSIQTMQFMMKNFKTVEAHIFIGYMINRIMTILNGMAVCQKAIMTIG